MTSCSLLEISPVSSAMIAKKLRSECLQTFAASCQEPFPLEAHSESLVMCISQDLSEATQ